MPMPQVVVSAPLPDDLRTLVAARCEILDVPTGQDIVAAIGPDKAAQASAILCTMRSKIDARLLDAMPALRVVSNFAVGFDNIDVAAATQRNVLVCNTPRVLDGAVADLTFGLILCLSRDMVKGDAFVRSGAWTKGPAPLTRDIRGKTLGLLGMGRIGRVVARTAKAFDMTVIYHNRNRDEQAESEGLAAYRGRDDLFAQSDFLSVHIPLSPDTRHSIGAREFGLMKPSAFIVNTARGAVIDENALIEALSAGTIAGAGLDVMETEPLPPSSPLCAMPNVVLQAHVGSATVETRRAMIELASRNMLDALSGTRPAAMVNPAIWDGEAATA